MLYMEKDYVMKVKMVFEGVLLPCVGVFGLAGKTRNVKRIDIKPRQLPGTSDGVFFVC